MAGERAAKSKRKTKRAILFIGGNRITDVRDIGSMRLDGVTNRV
ncbi:hypothetical protein SAMN05216404_11297 [Nitrosospira multiformis]|uniref:Uncharacterized protein n=1 Tax=Nitrosospira multiformis TaxID=1231 RepID=A0A1H8MDM5_9PROT|nr:hypothetical protein SAMN05216404_11297 [Nitrosospira multiformis]